MTWFDIFGVAHFIYSFFLQYFFTRLKMRALLPRQTCLKRGKIKLFTPRHDHTNQNRNQPRPLLSHLPPTQLKKVDARLCYHRG
jgi:hypothetical protein